MAKRGYCHCDAKLPLSGKCAYGCSPFADPEWLRLQEAKRREREAYRRREERVFITYADLRRVRRAVKKFDPEYRAAAKRGKQAAAIRYRMGGAR